MSEYIFQSVVKHGYDGIDPEDFRPLVRVRVGDQVQRGWVRVS